MEAVRAMNQIVPGEPFIVFKDIRIGFEPKFCWAKVVREKR
jgi:hypothetical protein